MVVYTISSHLIPLCRNDIPPRLPCQEKCDGKSPISYSLSAFGDNDPLMAHSRHSNDALLSADSRRPAGRISGRRDDTVIDEARLAESHGEGQQRGAINAIERL